MTVKQSSHIAKQNNDISIEHLEKLLHLQHELTVNFLKDIGVVDVDVPQFNLDYAAYAKNVIDDRIDLPEKKRDLLVDCLYLLKGRVKPVITEKDINVFLQMNFKGFGDKPNKRIKLEYHMKKTHLFYFFRLVFNALYNNTYSNGELQQFRDTIAQSFVGFDSITHESIVKYFHEKKEVVERAFARDISSLKAENI